MTPEESEKIERLCMAIQAERDQAKFTALVEELNDFLKRQEQKRLENAELV